VSTYLPTPCDPHLMLDTPGPYTGWQDPRGHVPLELKQAQIVCVPEISILLASASFIRKLLFCDANCCPQDATCCS